jgi:UDP-N-acetyl-D-mannosaminuronic acid dehydrogenase
MGSAEAAELTKLAETTYRDVNIALANEFARHADDLGVDIHQVIDAANSQPYSHIHRPGVAVGGHCIPVYPRFYLAGDPGARLPATAREVNLEMPRYAADLLSATLDGSLKGRRIVIFGVAYRGGVKETAFTGAAALRDALTREGAYVFASDPLYDDDELRSIGYQPWDGSTVDGAVIQADHEEYRSFGKADLGNASGVVDGRDVLDVEALRADGVRVARIGRP